MTVSEAVVIISVTGGDTCLQYTGRRAKDLARYGGILLEGTNTILFTLTDGDIVKIPLEENDDRA